LHDPYFEVIMDGATLRNTMLEVISEYSHKGFNMQSRVMLREVFDKLGISNTDIESQQMILTYWHDLIGVRKGKLR